MAIVTLSELFSNLRGSIGQTTFSNNAAGLIAKRKLSGHKKYTKKQQPILLTHSDLVGYWQRLSLSNKLLWNDYGTLHTRTDRYGLTKTLSGWNWYAAINYMSLLFNSVTLNTPTTYQLPSSVPSFIVQTNDSVISIQMSSIVNADSTYLMIFGTLPTRSSALIPRSQYRLLTTVKNDSISYKNLTPYMDSVAGFSWRNMTRSNHFNIGIMVVPVDSVSLIEGVATQSRGTWAPTGIGTFRIGSTFIIA